MTVNISHKPRKVTPRGETNVKRVTRIIEHMGRQKDGREGRRINKNQIVFAVPQ